MIPPYMDMKTDEKHAALARTIGSRSDYVARLLTARALFQQAERDNLLGDLDVDRLQSDFSLLTTALSYQNIASYVNLDPRDVTLDGLSSPEFGQLLRWLYKTSEPTAAAAVSKSSPKSVVGESRNLKKLSKVVTNPHAIAHLNQTGDLDGAQQKASVKDPIDGFRAQLMQIGNGLDLALDMVDELKGLDESDTSTISIIEGKVFDLDKKVKKAIREAN